jgi:hypothetical protein
MALFFAQQFQICAYKLSLTSDVFLTYSDVLAQSSDVLIQSSDGLAATSDVLAYYVGWVS